MLSGIRNFFSALNPFQAKKKESLDLSDSKIVKATKTVLSQAPNSSSKTFVAKPIKSEGWFSCITNLFRRKLYELFKGEPPSKPQEIRQLLTDIGGAENTLTTKHGVAVRTMHLKASNVLEKIKDAGGSKATLSIGEKEILGFAFDQAPENLKATLTKLGFLNCCYTNSKGQVSAMNGPWVMEVIDGKTYILTKNDFDFLIQKDALTETGFSSSVALVKSPINAPQGTNATVVLGGGICSYYESYRSAQETAAFLIRGLDVVIFQDKNLPLESEADYHVMAAREAIFTQLKSLGLRNDQIILKGLCFSSVPAVELSAAMGGDVPVIIDQGYTDIKPVAVNGIGNNVWSPLSNAVKFVAGPMIAASFPEMDLNYEMKSLRNLTGPVCVIDNVNDELVPKEERQKLQDASKEKSFYQVSISNPAIRHAGPWYQDNSAATQLDKFLKDNFNNQPIIGVS